ncbi:MAG: TonB family protein [gamma proteobacterium symbiont of Taylorina sp.]|nr:TonB family protein [gamma proteobacterium symbiont of Taylorina sp.]
MYFNKNHKILSYTAPTNLLTAFVIALIIHNSMIFGISFTTPPIKKHSANQTLDIVLVNTKAEKAPENPDFLAQADQVGGGNIKEKAKPTSKNPGEIPTQGNALENRPKVAPKPVPKTVNNKPILSAAKPTNKKAPKLQKKKKSRPKKKPVVINDYMADLQKQIIEIEAELDEKNKMYAKRPKATYITASTQRTPDAMYLKSWTKKIERIGNLNYPAQARKDKLEGQLVLIVAISPDGDIISIRISRSSGHNTLDNAARKIVQLAAPYAPVPQSVLRGNNRLVITRTWQFTHNSGKSFTYK